jgi:hypothetical protein
MFAGTSQFFPFAGGNQPVGAWYLWDFADGPLTITLNTSIAIASIWVPAVPASISYYNGNTTVDVTPDYVSPFASGSELVPIDQGETTVTLACLLVTGSCYVFASTGQFDPFRSGPGNAVSAVEVTAPIVNLGTLTAPNIGIETPLPIADGGTGTATPSLVAGTGITITGEFPNQEISSSATGTVESVTATAPITSSGGPNPVIGMTNPLPINYGGTGTNTPSGVTAGTGIDVTGTFPDQVVSLDSAVVVGLNGLSGLVTLVSTDGSIGITPNSPSPGEIDLSANASFIGAVRIAIGNSSDPTITLPGTAAETWTLQIHQGFQQTTNSNLTIVNTATNIASFQTTADNVAAFNAVCWIDILSVGTAVGGATASVATAITGGAVGGNAPWCIIAVRTA